MISHGIWFKATQFLKNYGSDRKNTLRECTLFILVRNLCPLEDKTRVLVLNARLSKTGLGVGPGRLCLGPDRRNQSLPETIHN